MYLRVKITQDGIVTDPKKTEAITSIFLSPKNLKLVAK